MKKIRIRRGILATVIGLLVLCAVPIWAAGDWVGSTTAQELTEQLMDRVREAATLRLQQDLRPAHAIAMLNAEMLRHEVFDLTEEDQEWLLGAFEVQLDKHGVDGIFVGMPDGAFWMVRRRPDGTPRRIVLPPMDERAAWRAPDPAYQTFDPRRRGWYREASDAGTWSAIYPFQAGHPGITVSARVELPPHEDDDGEPRDSFLGVVGVDVALADLTAYVSRLEATPNSRVFLLDHERRVIAHADDSLLLRGPADIAALVPQREAAVVHALLSQEQDSRTRNRHSVSPAGLGRHFAVLAPLDTAGALPAFVVGIAVPEADVLGPIQNNRVYAFVILAVTLGIGVFLAYAITRGIARPMERLQHEMARVQQMDFDQIAQTTSSYVEVTAISEAFDRMVQGLRSFSRYVPRDVVRDLIASGKAAEIGSEERELSVFFSDIAGFTADAERTGPRDLFEQLGEYFEIMTRAVRGEGGTLDKYIGDAVMAFWNAPLPREDHSTHAALAAAQAQRELAEHRKRWARDGKGLFHTRIGLTRATVMVGNVGATDRLNYTALGDGVNLAARLEGANKYFDTMILADEAFAAACDPSRVIVQPLDRIAVVGREAGVLVFEVLGPIGDVSAERCEAAGLYAEALESYLATDFTTAAERFRAVLDRLPGYRPAELLRRRCETWAVSPPANWTGVFELKAK